MEESQRTDRQRNGASFERRGWEECDGQGMAIIYWAEYGLRGLGRPEDGEWQMATGRWLNAELRPLSGVACRGGQQVDSVSQRCCAGTSTLVDWYLDESQRGAHETAASQQRAEGSGQQAAVVECQVGRNGRMKEE